MSTIKPATSALLAVLLLPVATFAQPPESKSDLEARIRQVERGLFPPALAKGGPEWTLEERMKHYKVPGVSVAVINNFRVEWSRAYGVKDVDTKEKVTETTLFQAGSISKPVAAMVALARVEKGKLSLDEDINNKLTSWKVPDNKFTAKKKVTLANLLSHTAGLTVHGFPGYAAGKKLPTLQQVLDGVAPANTAAVRVDIPPGTKFRYSGGGTTVAQLALMDIEKKPFPEIALETVLQPLGMGRSTYEQPLSDGWRKKAASGHYVSGKAVKGKFHTYPEMAAAGLWTTPGDLAQFAIEMQLSLQGKSNKVLSKEMTARMLTPVVEDFNGLGFFLIKKGKAMYFGHGGADEGFRAELIVHKEKGYGVVVMVNSDNGQIINEVIGAVAREYKWEDFQPPPASQALELIRDWLLERPKKSLRADDGPAAAKTEALGPAGIWEGALKVGAIELRLVVKITSGKDGSLKGTLDSIDQGAKDIPIDTVTVKEHKVELNLKKLAAKFEGELSKDGTELKGEWEQGGLKLPLNLKRTKKATVLKRPQEPKKPYPYKEEEVVVDHAKAEVKLAGTLTLPKGDGPFPAALLISGSGPQDRNEELLGHKPFLVIADYLTRRGIAVLRVDDRGVGKSTGKFGEATSEDFTLDALACVAFLKERKEINPKQIGLIGHSEGGLIAPIAAVRSSDVALIVLLAGPGLPGDEILYSQGEAITKALKASKEAIARQRRIQEGMLSIAKAEKDAAVAERKIKEFLEKELAALPAEEKKEAEKLKGVMEAQVKAVLSPWFRYFLSYDPRPTLQKVKCPVLALTGELDLQVLPKENLGEIEKALKQAGHSDFTIKELPKLNHLFQHCETGSPSEYGKIEETFAPQALELIADWILERTKKAR